MHLYMNYCRTTTACNIAWTLVSKPKIIFADKPMCNLDKISLKEGIELLKMAQVKYNETVVLVTHNESICEFADRVIRIEDGNIIDDTLGIYNKKYFYSLDTIRVIIYFYKHIMKV